MKEAQISGMQHNARKKMAFVFRRLVSICRVPGKRMVHEGQVNPNLMSSPRADPTFEKCEFIPI